MRIVHCLAGFGALVCVLAACSSPHHSSGGTTTTTTRPAVSAPAPRGVATLSCPSGVSGGAAERPPGMYGTLRMIGGPAPGVSRPVAGTITIADATGRHCDLPVLATGSFDVMLPVGKYRVSGHSPDFGDGKYECSGGVVTVTSARETAVTVVCPV